MYGKREMFTPLSPSPHTNTDQLPTLDACNFAHATKKLKNIYIYINTTWRFLLDETGCSGMFLRHFMTIRLYAVYMSLSTLVFRKPKLSRLYIQQDACSGVHSACREETWAYGLRIFEGRTWICPNRAAKGARISRGPAACSPGKIE